jgi:hypothetical protein
MSVLAMPEPVDMSAVARQPPAPLHTLPAPHSPPGSLPSGIGVHLPTLPGRLQAWQVPLHAVSQQTPSTQLPVEQTEPSLPQLPPGPRHVRWHAPAPLHALVHEPTLAQSPLGSVPAAANALPQPLVSQMLTVHAAVGGGQTVPVPPLHTVGVDADVGRVDEHAAYGGSEWRGCFVHRHRRIRRRSR